MSFTCPRCGATSHNPNDQRYGYCGRCHEFTGGPSGVDRLVEDAVVAVTGVAPGERFVRRHRVHMLRAGLAVCGAINGGAIAAGFYPLAGISMVGIVVASFALGALWALDLS